MVGAELRTRAATLADAAATIIAMVEVTMVP